MEGERLQDWERLQTQPEGQFFERKSCYERGSGSPKRREAREVARDVAETLAAMANADGGTLALGIEDDGTPTGVDYPPDRLEVIVQAPKTHITPPVKASHRWATVGEIPVLVFEVDWSPEVHQLRDGRYVLRVADSNMPFSAADIAAMKEGKRRRVTELQFVHEASLSDINSELIDMLREKARVDLPDEELLLRYRLIEPRNGRYLLSLACLLLFAKDPIRWHPSCHVDFVRWEGNERRFGAELNVIKRVRIEAPLPKLIESAFETITAHIRERQALSGLSFESRFEYPPFAWQEALINAVAHRDYGLTGTPIEVWLFDNRLEIRSPGTLVEPVTLERLRNRERIHASRNPRIVRVLTDLGYMRELGEGVPRMFAVMEREGLHPPDLRMEADAIFTVILYNTPIFPPETLKWLRQFEPLGISPTQRRLLAYAHTQGGRFTSRDFQKLAGIGVYEASQQIKDLIRKGIVRLSQKRGRVYTVLAEPESTTAEKPPEYALLEPILAQKGYVTNKDIREALGISAVQARRVAVRLQFDGWLHAEGDKRGRRYRPKRELSTH
jgi:ATP-dependent DNA helicase RecG